MAKCVVTGASGFVGAALVRRLLQEGHSVVGVARRELPELVRAGARWIRYDLSKDLAPLSDQLQAVATDGIDVIFHTAAKVGAWGEFDDFYRTNFQATQGLLRIAEQLGIERFIYTSSPSVVSGSGDLLGVDESFPYPTNYEAFYPQTKALAEQAVLEFNSPSGVKTVALRPHLIFGPGDQHLIPTIVSRAKRGRLFQVGRGTNLTDVSFIEDCVSAHIAACQALGSNPAAAGKAYFISQGEPVCLWEWINDILSIFGCPPVRKRVPARLALLLAELSEWGYRKFRPNGEGPTLTRFLVSQMSTSHYFDISAAREQLGYRPKFSVAEAIKATRRFYNDSTLVS